MESRLTAAGLGFGAGAGVAVVAVSAGALPPIAVATAATAATGPSAAAVSAGGVALTSATKRLKNASAICLAVASISRAPSWAILPPTCALTS